MAIVSLVAALMVMAWQRAQQHSRATACMGNLRQIGAALTKYVGERDGTFPTLVMARLSVSDPSPALDTELGPYLSDPRVLACPDDAKHIAVATGTSYLWNVKLNGQRLGNLSVRFLSMEPIEDPGRIMVMGDKEGFHPCLDNKLNILYADGHASRELTFMGTGP